MDEWWVQDAIEQGAEVFISADWDIGVLCNKHNKRWIQLPKGLGQKEMFKYIVKTLKRK